MEQEPTAGFEAFDQTHTDSLAPLNIIRTETVLSKLPVHNLAKKGKVDIRIVRRGTTGDLQLKWEVSHSDRYGQPRQLAYKLDTLVVNRRIDEAERPLPSLIRLGSLKEICKELGLYESGKNTKDLRVAFLQNASAFINAHLTYRATDGTERTLEAGFTRYGVVFTGEKLPDGRSADGVYITLNQPYWEVVNTAPVRPLNYDYLKALTPAAQRFYEVVSFRVFAALRNSRAQAKLLYSDYCAFSAQQRYYDYEHFRVQMYKIHKPHLASGYLKSIAIESTTDVEGQPDWMMIYSPGPKARAEFVTFTGKQTGMDAVTTDSAERQEKGREMADPRLAALVERGIAAQRARKLLIAMPPDQPVDDQLEWADSVIGTARQGSFHNPAGFYYAILRDDVRPPETFVSSARKRRLQDLASAEQARIAEEQAAQLSYDEYRRDQVNQRLAAMQPSEFEAIAARKKQEYRRQYRSLPDTTIDELGLTGARAEVQKALNLLTLTEFMRLCSGPEDPKDPKGQDQQQQLFA